MKRILLTFAGLLITCTFAFSAPDREHTLKVYNWADYIDEDLIPEFEAWYKEQTGEEVKIIYQLFDINEVMLSKIEKGHEDYDVVCPSDYIIERMLRDDLILPIGKDFGNTPNYIDGNISPFITEAFKDIDGSGKNASDYAVAYMWGTAGFLYNTKYVTRDEMTSWGALANPKYEGKIFIKNAARDVYSPLLTYLRQDELKAGKITLDDIMRDSSDESIAEAEAFLKSISKNIAGWEEDFGKEQMTKEKAWINFTWSGDANWAIEEAAAIGVPLDYEVPQEGSQIWFDGWVIPKYAVNKKAAEYFINFMCKPENAIRNMDEIGYVSAIYGDTVLDYMTDENFPPINVSYFFGEGHDSVCVNPVFYPDQSVIDRCHIMHDSGERTQLLLEMWGRVKGDNASSTTYIIVSGAIIVIITMAVISIVKKNRKRNKIKSKKRKTAR